MNRNDEISKLVETSGVKNVLASENGTRVNQIDPNVKAVFVDDIWNLEREKLAQEMLSKDTSKVPIFWQEKYEREAAKNWDMFYRRNRNKFYKDRHYLHLEFPELVESGAPRILLEAGCGVGNAALPLLEINPDLNIIALDFAEKAIELLKVQPLYDEHRVSGYVCDLTEDALPEEATKNGANIDFAIILFVLSAIHPSKMEIAIQKVANAMKPGGKIMFRDYGRYDQAQLRFKSGHKLDENFYVRQDLTRAYYFTLEEVQEMFCKAGLVVNELQYIRRQYVNRKQDVSRFRVWIHGKFEKIKE